MNDRCDISVVISTYNRCDLLPRALESVLAQEAGDVRYEVIVVDNNSTDRTRAVVESMIPRAGGRLRYVFEGRQGLSHARNAGIAESRGPLVVFTDDDVRAAPDWIAQIKRAFDAHPEVDFIGGKVLPNWLAAPPAWVARDIWAGPLALLDEGAQSFYSNPQHPFFFPGANFAFRREVFARVGLFSPDFQRVKDNIGSVEDSEFMVRVWRGGCQGMYVPDVVVTADVQVERLTKAYFRRWHKGNGRYCALLRLNEIMDEAGRLRDTPDESLALFGTPAYLYRELLATAGKYLAHTLTGRTRAALRHELRARYLVSYIRQRYETSRAERRGSNLTEVLGFVGAAVGKKAGRRGT